VFIYVYFAVTKRLMGANYCHKTSIFRNRLNGYEAKRVASRENQSSPWKGFTGIMRKIVVAGSWSTRRVPERSKPRLEALEDRWVLSTANSFTVVETLYSVPVTQGQTIVWNQTAVSLWDATQPLAATPLRTSSSRDFSGVVATFNVSDPTGLTAMIDWGDGQTSAGTIVAVSGGVQVFGSHTYNQTGVFTIRVSLNGRANDLVSGMDAAQTPFPFESPSGYTLCCDCATQRTGSLSYSSSLRVEVSESDQLPWSNLKEQIGNVILPGTGSSSVSTALMGTINPVRGSGIPGLAVLAAPMQSGTINPTSNRPGHALQGDVGPGSIPLPRAAAIPAAVTSNGGNGLGLDERQDDQTRFAAFLFSGSADAALVGESGPGMPLLPVGVEENVADHELPTGSQAEPDRVLAVYHRPLDTVADRGELRSYFTNWAFSPEDTPTPVAPPTPPETDRSHREPKHLRGARILYVVGGIWTLLQTKYGKYLSKPRRPAASDPRIPSR
jgi:hypothetical protein